MIEAFDCYWLSFEKNTQAFLRPIWMVTKQIFLYVKKFNMDIKQIDESLLEKISMVIAVYQKSQNKK